MSRRCPSCQAENAPQDQYCIQCGHSLMLQRMPTVLLRAARRLAGQPGDTPAPTRTLPAIPPAKPVTAEVADISEAEPTPADGLEADLSADGVYDEAVTLEELPVATIEVEEAEEAEPVTEEAESEQLPWSCAQCATVNPPEAEYCDNCGALPTPTPIAPVALTPPESVPPTPIEKKGWRMVLGWGTNVGTARKGGVDEDSVFCMTLNRAFQAHAETFGLYIVADGMGGQAAGEVASKMAIETISAAIISESGPVWLGGLCPTADAVETALRSAITAAHLRISKSNDEDTNDKGTTLTMALVCDGVAHVANVGDSRTYLFRSGPGLVRISHDHSLVQTLVDAGQLTPDEVYTDPRRNIVTSALGSPEEEINIGVYRRDLLPGDRLLLCSDGLWEMAHDTAIAARLFQLDDPQECADELIALACRNGGLDNVSVIVVHAEHV